MFSTWFIVTCSLTCAARVLYTYLELSSCKFLLERVLDPFVHFLCTFPSQSFAGTLRGGFASCGPITTFQSFPRWSVLLPTPCSPLTHAYRDVVAWHSPSIFTFSSPPTFLLGFPRFTFWKRSLSWLLYVCGVTCRPVAAFKSFAITLPWFLHSLQAEWRISR